MNTTERALVWVLGSGGREHALAWKLARSLQVGRVCVLPGNDAMLDEDGTPMERAPADLSLGMPEFERLAREARAQGVALVVVGPDDPLAAGVADAFARERVPCFGPTALAARIEASKLFAKSVMRAAGVPTAEHFAAESREDAEKILADLDWSDGRFWVLKADGLALGKGVVVCQNLAEARAALPGLAEKGRVLIEEGLRGEEVSWLAFCDGSRAAMMDPARDYKRIGTGDQGANTGGMGAISPVPGVPNAWRERVRREVFEPVLREMRARGCEFHGMLYAGLMADVAGDRYWVLEFNARFGDPETQALLPRMDDDLFEWCRAAAQGRLPMGRDPRFSSDAHAFVVLAAKGYPDAPEKGADITAPALVPPSYFCAGMRRDGKRLVVSGGRVLGAGGRGARVADAARAAYAGAERVSFAGMQLRRDIGGGVA